MDPYLLCITWYIVYDWINCLIELIMYRNIPMYTDDAVLLLFDDWFLNIINYQSTKNSIKVLKFLKKNSINTSVF